MVKGLTPLQQNRIPGDGGRTCVMVKAAGRRRQEKAMLEATSVTSVRAMALGSVSMVTSMLANGTRTRSMEKVNGQVLMARHTKVSGSVASDTVSVNGMESWILSVRRTRATGTATCGMDRVIGPTMQAKLTLEGSM